MKVITVEQPWATLVAMGVKTILTYPDATPYVGPVTIRAADSEVSIDDPYLISVLASAGYRAHSLPRGVVVAAGYLESCEPIRCANIPCYPEYAFSEFREGWYAWKLSGITATDFRSAGHPVQDI